MVQTTLSAEEVEYIVDEARYGELESLKQIFEEIDHQLLYTIRDKSTDSTLIHMASANGHLEVVKFLLSLVASDDVKLQGFVNAQNSSGNTALHWAALNGHLEIVKLLCEEYNADAFLKNKVDHDAVFEAENNNKEVIEEYFLQKYSLDPEEEGKDTVVRAGSALNPEEPTFKPGKEIDEVTKEAIAAKAELSKQKQEKALVEKTQGLSL